jgi:uncharacterized protein DUF2569
MIPVMRLDGAREARKPAQPRQRAALPKVRGWLLVYIAGLAVLLVHSAALTIGSIVIYAHPAAAGLHSFVPLGFLLLYVTTNLFLIIYAIFLFVLMARRRRSAIIHNIVFNLLSVAFLVIWHLFGEKSNFGTVVDSVPGLIGAAYFMLSRRVRNTFIIGSRSGLY